jgi:5'(3')-deoxyribonucleotidase
MTRKPRLGLDVDGVLADFITPALAIMRDMGVGDYTPEDMTDFEMSTLIPEGRRNEFWKRCGEPGWCRNLKPYDGAQDGVKALAKVADIYIVTSPLHSGPQWTHEREAWLWEHFGIPRSRVIHTAAKYTFAGDMLVDDKPEHVEKWSDEHRGVPVLWARPYNERARKLMVRTNSWFELTDIASEVEVRL